MQFHEKIFLDLFDFTSFLPGLFKIFWPAVKILKYIFLVNISVNKIYSFSKLSNLVPIYYYYNMPNLTHIIIVFFREHTYISILKNGVRGRKKASPSNIGFSKTEIWTDTAATTNFKTKLWIFSAIQSIWRTEMTPRCFQLEDLWNFVCC